MPVPLTDLNEKSDLGVALRVLSRRRVTVLVAVAIGILGAIAYSVLLPTTYSASARVLVPTQSPSAALDPTAAQSSVVAYAERQLADDLQFAQGDAVRQAAEKAFGRPIPDVSVSASSTADILTFTATSRDPASSAEIANSYAQGYITAQRNGQVSQYTQQVAALQNTIGQLQARQASLPASSPQQAGLQGSITSLSQSLQQLKASSELVQPSGASVVTAATVPNAPVSPRLSRDLPIGVLLGIVVGVALAFIIDRLDVKMRSREEIEQASGGVPVLGMIPTFSGWRDHSETHVALIEEPTSPVSEAYRTLRTAVQFLNVDSPKQVLAVTSPRAGEGKSTTIANLAVGLARTGLRVIVVSCDLRKPRLHQFFGESNVPGLTSVLLGEAELADTLQRVEGEPNLRLIASGPVPPNPAEILTSSRVHEVVAALSASSDIVLLDCPPLLPVTDAVLLSKMSDGVLLVVVAGASSRPDLARSMELLNQVEAPVLGTIINRVPSGSGYSYGYDYGYYSGSEQRNRNGPNTERDNGSAGAGRDHATVDG